MKSLHLLLMLLCTAEVVFCETWQFEGAAVQDLGRMNRETLFANWLPFRLGDGTTPQISGSFLLYQHESLQYYFGTFLNEQRAWEAQEAGASGSEASETSSEQYPDTSGEESASGPAPPPEIPTPEPTATPLQRQRLPRHPFPRQPRSRRHRFLRENITKRPLRHLVQKIHRVQKSCQTGNGDPASFSFVRQEWSD